MLDQRVDIEMLFNSDSLVKNLVLIANPYHFGRVDYLKHAWGRLRYFRENVNQSCFSSTISSQQTKNRWFIDLKIDIVESMNFVFIDYVLFGQVLCLDHDFTPVKIMFQFRIHHLV